VVLFSPEVDVKRSSPVRLEMALLSRTAAIREQSAVGGGPDLSQTSLIVSG
jgi:hypothetical protein